MTADERFMRLALALGRRNLGRTWPNPSVGAVVVAGEPGAERIVGQGVTAPVAMSPPTLLISRSSWRPAVRTARSSTRSRKPGAKRSTCRSTASPMSRVDPLGTCA